MATKKDLLVLLLDVGEHMQPYLPLMHRMVFNVLNVKLLSKPNHEVAVILYGTKDTRHKLYDPSDPLSYHHVTVLRPLQNLSSYLELEPFAFAADPPRTGGDGDSGGSGSGGAAAVAVAATSAMDPQAIAEAEAALLAHVETAGLACLDAAAVCGRAARLFGPPGPKADWADGLVVALDVLASTLEARFDSDKKEAKTLGQLKVLLVSNLLGQSEPFEADFRSALVETCTSRRVMLEVACLDHYVPPQRRHHQQQQSTAVEVKVEVVEAEGADPLALLPAVLAAARRSNMEQLHLLKSELSPAPFRHLRQPAELLCLFRAKEVSYQASNAVFFLTLRPREDHDAAVLPPPLSVNVKLYKKIRRAAVDEWKTVLEAKPGAAAGAAGGGGAHEEDGGGGGGSTGRGFEREIEYEDPTTGQKFTRDEHIIKGYSYGKQAVPIPQYDNVYGHVADEQMRKFKEKDFSLVGFVDVNSVPRHRLIDEPHVVLGDSAASAAAIASLALSLKEHNKAGVVRFLFRKEAPQLGLLTPHLSDSPDVPNTLLLSPLPFTEDIRTYTFSTFRSEQEARDLPRRLAEERGEALPPPPPPLPLTQPLPPTQAATGASGSSLSQVLSNLNGLALGTTAANPGMRFERLQPDDDQQDAAMALVRALDLGPSPLPGSLGGHSLGGDGRSGRSGSGLPAAAARGEPHLEALAPEAVPNPVMQRVYALVTSRALDAMAQLPEPGEDPLVDLVLQPHGRYWPAGAKEALRWAKEKLRTRDRVDGAGPASKRNRREIDGGGGGGGASAGASADGGGDGGVAAAAAAAGGGANAVVVFDPSAAGGTAAARVSRVGELSAVEDFRAMLAQGRDSASDAVRQMQELVRVLVGRSIGDQLYDKAAKCVQALREGCTSTGRAGAFNRFLCDLVDWCKYEDRYAFVLQLASRDVSLVSREDVNRHRRSGLADGTAGAAGAEEEALLEDDGGAVTSREASQFLERLLAPVEVEVEATLPAVVQDEEFEDMD